MTIQITFFNTELTPIRVKFLNGQVLELSLQNKQHGDSDANWSTPFGRWLKAYLRGSKEPIDLSLCNLNWARPFSKKVYQALWSIPKGETKTYAEIAMQIGAPKASRAVGQANRRNLLPLIIPCHRVIAANSLGGYAFGLELKKKLLAFEGAHVS